MVSSWPTHSALLETPYNGADVWDLRNGFSTSYNNSASLYGWRDGGDYGLLGSPPDSPPTTGAYIPYPTYFAEELASQIIQTGGQVVQAASDNNDLSAYAVLEANGDLDLLVINKSGPSASDALTEQFQIAGFQPQAKAEVWQYGEAQDTAQSQSSTGQSALANSTTTLSLNGSNFSYTFPAYSMTVLQLSNSTGGKRTDDRHGSFGLTEPGLGYDNGPFRLGHRPGRCVVVDLRLGGGRNSSRASHLQPKRNQFRAEYDGHLRQGGDVQLPGHCHRSKWLDDNQHGVGHSQSVAHLHHGHAHLGDGGGGRHGPVQGQGPRSICRPAGRPTELHVVDRPWRRLDRCDVGPLCGHDDCELRHGSRRGRWDFGHRHRRDHRDRKGSRPRVRPLRSERRAQNAGLRHIHHHQHRPRTGRWLGAAI